MEFIKYLSNESLDDTKNRIYNKVTKQGLAVRRGMKKRIGSEPYSTDPGDMGRGIYYSTNYFVAKQYGQVEKSVIKLSNPLILTAEEAYQLADKYQTVRLGHDKTIELLQQVGRDKLVAAESEELLKNAERMTKEMLANGYDGMVVIHPRGRLEIVDYRPYR